MVIEFTRGEDFDYLILSPGAKPIIPKIKGIETKNKNHKKYS